MRSIAAAILMLLVASAAHAAPADVDATIAKVRSELAHGHAARAERLANDALATAPSNVELIVLHAQALRALNRKTEARDEVKRALILEPENDAALRLRRALDRDLQSSAVGVTAVIDRYQHASTWRELQVGFKRNTTFGPLLARVSRASRFGLDDGLVELEAYPRFNAATYGYFAAGLSSSADLYPRSRFAAELFRAIGGGFEASLGWRRLNFSNDVSSGANVFTASGSRYVRDWQFSLRVYRTADIPQRGTALNLAVRRYFGNGDEYIGLRAGRGSTRDEIRGLADLQSLDSRDIAVEGAFALSQRWLLDLRAGAGKQDVGGGHDVRHLSMTSGVTYRW